LHHLFPAVPSVIKDVAAGLIAGLTAAGVVNGGRKLALLLKR